jgi:hypothetical protein
VKAARRERLQPAGYFDRLNNGLVSLVLVTGVSYLTTLVRERFLYQHEYGTHALDLVVVLLAVTAIVGNALGILLAFWWSAGRIGVRAVRRGVLASAGVVAIVSGVSTVGALLLAYLVAAAGFTLATQRAAGMGRQFYAVLGAVTAPGPTILVWTIVGVRTTPTILLGYAVGTIWQAAWALLVGWGGSVDRSSSTDSLLWPVVYIAAVQADGVADVAILLLAGRGWASACGFAYNALTAVVVIFVGPLGAQALAGRFNPDRPARLLIGSAMIAGAYLALAPFVLRYAIHGGAVVGSGYHRVLYLTLLYAPAIPFAIVWQLVTRADHRRAERWRSLAMQGVSLFTVHLVFLAILALSREWRLVPLSTGAAFAIQTGVLLVSRRRSIQAVLAKST